MKKLINILVGILLTTTSAFSQLSRTRVTNDSDFFLGAIISGQTYEKTKEGKLLGTFEGELTVSSSVFELDIYKIKSSKEDTKRLSDKIYQLLKDDSQSNSTTITNLHNGYNSNKAIDALFQTENAASTLLSNPNIATENNISVASFSIEYANLIADLPNITQEERAKYNPADKPKMVATLSFGRDIKIIIASPKDDNLIKQAYNLALKDNADDIAKINAILADASIFLFTSGNKPLQTVGKTPYQILRTYFDYIIKPLEPSDFDNPLSFEVYPINYN